MADKICLGCIKKYSDKYDVCPYCGYADGTPAKEAYHLAPGTVINGRYIIGRVIGYGGFGITYIGYDGLFEKKIAIKEYLPGEFATRLQGTSQVSIYTGDSAEQFHRGIEKFVDEAGKLSKFKSTPGIVSVYDTFTANNTAYIAMEYLEGESLKTKLDREGVIGLDEALEIILPVLDALKEIHKAGILHRDIAPDNIFICKNGDIKLLDFGAARYATSAHSKSLSVIVKPGYAPQEQYRSRGDQGPWTDVYACAATLYKMITGITPEDSMERGSRDTLAPPSELGIDIPKNTENAIMNALNLRIEDRTQTAEQFEADLITGDEVKRNKTKPNKMDIGQWPLWIKILSGVAVAAVAIFLALMVTGVISFDSVHISDKGALEEGKVYVPNVVNYSVEEARAILEDVNLQLIQEDARYSDEIPEGKVLAQNIPYGETVDINTGIKVTLSAGSEPIYMPDLVGEEQSAATDELNALELIVSTEETASEIAPGYVANQEYEENYVLHRGYKVVLAISKGRYDYDTTSETVVPELYGKDWEEAREEINTAHLYIYKISKEYSNDIPKGKIISQNIKSESVVKEGTNIGVVVSLGVETAKFPLIKLKHIDDAMDLLNSEGFLVERIETEENENVNKDHVTRVTYENGVEISAGDDVRKDQKLIIYVSEGNTVIKKSGTKESLEETDTSETKGTNEQTKETVKQEDVSVPNINGKTRESAEKALSDAGLSVGSVSYMHDENSADGTVLSQGIDAGTKVEKGTCINIVVCNNEKITEYRYRIKSTATSDKDSMTGWTLTGSEIVWGEYGEWSDWSETAVEEDEYTDVEVKTETSVPDNPGEPYSIPSGSGTTTKNNVKWVQAFLNYYFEKFVTDIDGIYGTNTFKYVKEFQRILGLVSDGIVGSTTISKMLEIWREGTTTEITYYRYRKRTCTTVYYFEKWSEWSSWSTTAASGTDVLEVQTRESYRY